MKRMTQYGSLILASLLLSLTAFASLKVWVSGETLRYTDLNSNFDTINTAATRSLVNADISGSAAIAHSKLATPGLVPKAIAKVGVTGTPCTAGTCTVALSYGGTITAVFNSTGNYTVTIPTAGSTNFAAFATANTINTSCEAVQASATTVTVTCNDGATPSAKNAVFSLAVYY